MLDQNFIAILVVFGLTLIGVTLVESAALTHQLYESGKAAEEAYFEKVAKYWTPERLQSTRTLKPPQMPLEKRTSNLSIHIEKQMNTNEFKNDRFEYDDVLEGDLSFDSDETQRATRLTDYVTKTVGTLLFMNAYGEQLSCTASVVTSPSKSLVVTAARCLYHRFSGIWYSNFLFIPAAFGGYQPYGNWTGKKVAINPQYAAEDYSLAFLNYNYGFLVVARPDKRLIADVVGAQGISFTSKGTALVVSLGYSFWSVGRGNLDICSGFLSPSKCGVGSFKGRVLNCGGYRVSLGGPQMEGFNLTTGVGLIMSVNGGRCSSPYYWYDVNGALFDAETKKIYDSIKSSA